MVHLATVKKDSEAHTLQPHPHPLPQIETLDLNSLEEDGFYSAVYGSRYAMTQLPQTEMPEKEMPREIAYRMIKDELSLDGNPMLKYAKSFLSCLREQTSGAEWCLQRALRLSTSIG
jgi:glutamate decarboxylase